MSLRRPGRSEKIPRPRRGRLFPTKPGAIRPGAARVRIPIEGRRETRPFIGPTELELRAVPESELPGSILERIVYKSIQTRLGPPNPLVWDPQPAFMGGRLELGGMVADVIVRAFPGVSIIIQVQSFAFHPTGMEISASMTATATDRMVDIEQKAILEGMRDPITNGPIVVYEVWEDVVLNADRLEDWMDRHLRPQIYNSSNMTLTAGKPWMPNQAEWDALQIQVANLQASLDSLADLTRIGSAGGVLPIPTAWSNMRSNNWVTVSLQEGVGQYVTINNAISAGNDFRSSTNPWFVLVFPGDYIEDVLMASDTYVMSVVPRIPDLVRITHDTALQTIDFNGISRSGIVGVHLLTTDSSASDTFCLRVRGSCDLIYAIDYKTTPTNAGAGAAIGSSDENTNASGRVYLGEI